MNEETNINAEINNIPTAGQPAGIESFAPTSMSTAAVIHPNVTKMRDAFQAVIEESEFYTSEPKVNKFLAACKLSDPAQKYWKSSMTNARKELNDQAMEDAKLANVPVEMPSDHDIELLAIEKFKETWKKYGKGKPMPSLPLGA